jgi:hypothetical protein
MGETKKPEKKTIGISSVQCTNDENTKFVQIHFLRRKNLTTKKAVKEKTADQSR